MVHLFFFQSHYLARFTELDLGSFEQDGLLFLLLLILNAGLLPLVLSAEEVVNLTSRRLSVSPSCASSNSHRNYSFRRGSVWSVRSLASAEGEWGHVSKETWQSIPPLAHFNPPPSDEENTTEHTPTHHMLQPPQAVFPACICAAVLPIVHLMEDGEVREDGVAGRLTAAQKSVNLTRITAMQSKLYSYFTVFE